MGAESRYPGLPILPKPRRQSSTYRTISALILREMVTTYGRSPGGYLWAILEPIAAIALLSFAFSMAFHAPSLGRNFPLFYATAYLPYMLFYDVSGKVATAIRFSRPLMNFGAVRWLDAIAARYILNVATHLMVSSIVIIAMYAAFDLDLSINIVLISNAFLMASVLALGIGTANCFLFLAFPAWVRIWSIFTRPLFIISGVFFLFEDLPREIQTYLWFNPLFHITGEMRAGFYSLYTPSYVTSAYCYGVALALLFLGMAALSRHADALIHK